MTEAEKLRHRVGPRAFTRMLNHSKPANVEQWAFMVLHRMERRDETIRQAREEMKRIADEHPIMGPEDEEMFLEWESQL